MNGANGSPWAAFEARTWTALLEEFPDPRAKGQFEEYDFPKIGSDGKPVKDAQGKPVTEKRKGPKRMPIVLRESGDPAALVDIVFGGATGADKNRAMATLVTTSVMDPPISDADYHALALQCKLALFGEIMNHVRKEDAVDFSSGAHDSQKIPSVPRTDVGGHGAPRKSSAMVTPLES